MDTALDVPSMAKHLADCRRIAFVSHAGGAIVLRPINRFAGSDGVPRRLLPGDHFAGLTFAELASAFQGVVEIQSDTSEGKIVEGSALGAPSLLSFVVDPRGVVGVRALEGHSWAEDIAPGRSVFGQAASVLEAAGRGTLELEPETLSARLIGPRSTANGEDAAARDPDDGGGDGQPERADRSFPRTAAWAGSAALCLLAGVGVWTLLATGS
jgi:hypothetical protein